MKKVEKIKINDTKSEEMKINIEDDPGNDPNPLGGLVTTIIGESKINNVHVLGTFAKAKVSHIYAIAHDDKLNVTYVLDICSNILQIDHNKLLVTEFASNIKADSIVLVPESHRTSERYLIISNRFFISTLSSSGQCVPLGKVINPPEANTSSPATSVELWGGTLYRGGRFAPKFIVEPQRGPCYYRSCYYVQYLSSSLRYQCVNWIDNSDNGCNQVMVESHSKMNPIRSIVFKGIYNAITMISSDSPLLSALHIIDSEPSPLAGALSDRTNSSHCQSRDGRGSHAQFCKLGAMTLCSSQVNSSKIKVKIVATLNTMDTFKKWPPEITNIVAHLSSYISSYLLVVDGCSIRRVTLPIEFR